jgi:hypothetical protein
MSKLKKIMGTGAVITVLFAVPITVINEPAAAIFQTAQVSSGSTPVGNTAWQQFPGGEGIFLNVDTRSAEFKTTPVYITSLGGNNHHWWTTGATSIYAPTSTGFTVYVRWVNGGPLTPAMANEYGWHINWIAVPQ